MGFNPSDPIDQEVATMIRNKARAYANNPVDRAWDTEDFEQEIKVHLLQRGSKLVARTASQKTVLDRAIRNKMLNILESQRAQKRGHERTGGLDHDPVDAGEDLEVLKIQLDMAAAITSLRDDLREIGLSLKVLTPAEVIRHFKRPRGQVRQQMGRIGQHFTRLGLNPQPSRPRFRSVTKGRRS